jgi:hypothetical protein
MSGDFTADAQGLARGTAIGRRQFTGFMHQFVYVVYRHGVINSAFLL